MALGQVRPIPDTAVLERIDSWSKHASRRRAQFAVRWLLITIWIAGGVAMLAIWLNGGELTHINSPGAALTSAGRFTGLFGAYLLLVQVLFLARLPFLQWVVPFDRLTVIHRLNGKVCLYLILAHVVLIIGGYALLDRISILTEFWTVVTTYTGMIAALVGTIFLVLVVVTSFVIIRSRLRYELWLLVHLLAYAGLILAWFHEVPTGNDFVLSPLAAAFWTGLTVATLQLVILFRFVFPIARALWHGLRVAEVTPEAGGATTIRITGRHLDWLNAQSGQFFQWRFLDRSRWFEAHPFSLSAAPDGKSLRLTAKALGDFTGKLSKLKPGTFVVADGPFGGFTQANRMSSRVLLIAGGIGITPIRALLEEMDGDVVLIYRVVNDDELVFQDELNLLAEERNFISHYVVGDHRLAKNAKLLSPAHLTMLVPDVRTREIYLCGPPAMVAAIERTLVQLNIPEDHIHVERFSL